MTGFQLPLATYRVQLTYQFPFSQASEIIEYLRDLGITALYTSPLFQASPHSMHGYDVTDHSQVNTELGGIDGFEALSDTLQSLDMGLIVDVVPNHMEIDDPDNAWWNDVLEKGPSSPFAACFDIDWNPPKKDLQNRVLLPVLGDQFGKILESGQITLSYAEGSFAVSYFDHRFPLDPQTTVPLLHAAAELVRHTSAAAGDELIELESIVTALENLPPRTSTDSEALRTRHRELNVSRRRLTALASSSALVRRSIEAVVADYQGRPGDPLTFDRLEQLLQRQVHRLSHWRVATDEINYRRFFDINDLAAIRVEVPSVFDAVHQLLLRLYGEQRITGFRIDHPDGLYDPAAYFQRLQEGCRKVAPPDNNASPPGGGNEYACYVVAEKILTGNEQLPLNWAVHGTTGYDVLNQITNVLVDADKCQDLRSWYHRVCAECMDFDSLVYECKKLILNVSMASELRVLARRLDRISEQHRWSRDFTLWSLQEALRETIACFPVYRTYVTPDSDELSEEERRHVQQAIVGAKQRNPSTDESIFDFVSAVMSLESPAGLSEEQLSERREFVIKLQQLTGPVAAKGLEDTAFYRVYPLASLNEVGAEPDEMGLSVADFHRSNTVRCGRWPYGMVATSTHDTKRGEDVRAWLNVLSEIPHEWIREVEGWYQTNASFCDKLRSDTVPDRNEQYLIYQTLVGTLPFELETAQAVRQYADRMVAYHIKAFREAKQRTSWVNPNQPFEDRVAAFITGVLADPDNRSFVDQLRAFRSRINLAGLCNSLAQVALKATVPGVPDFYQGCELFNFSVVDPDNRRPIDYPARIEALRAIRDALQTDRRAAIAQMLDAWQNGHVKMFLTHAILQCRRQSPDVFLQGEYVPLEVTGARRRHAIAFARRRGDGWSMTVVPRLPFTLTAGTELPMGVACWEDTAVQLPADAPTQWKDILTSNRLDAAKIESQRSLPFKDVLAEFPVAVLQSPR